MSQDIPSENDYSLAAQTLPQAGFTAPELPYGPPMPKSYRPKIGLVGCGGITESHLNAYRRAGWEVAGFYDLDPARAAEKRDKYNPAGTVYESLEALLERPEIEVVDVATHPGVRVPLIEAALRAKKHVLSQKPFVLDLDAGRDLIALAEANGVYLAVNHNGRWAPHFSYLRLAAQAGIIGEIGSVVASVSWDHTWTKGTPFERIHHLLLYDFGIHWFDIVCQMYAGQQPTYVSTCLRSARDQPIAPPLLGTVAIGFETGVASLNFHAHSTAGRLDTTIVTGNNGVLFSQGPTLDRQKVSLQTREGSGPVRLRGKWFRQGFMGTMGELLCAIEEGRPPSNSAASAMDGLALCFAAIDSAATGQPRVPGRIRQAPIGCIPE